MLFVCVYRLCYALWFWCRFHNVTSQWWRRKVIVYKLQSHWRSHDLTLRKIAIWLSKNCQKLDIFSKKLTKIVLFFNKIANGNFVEKMTIFVNFFEKNVKFLAIFWQSNGNFPKGQVKTKAYLPGIKIKTNKKQKCARFLKDFSNLKL